MVVNTRGYKLGNTLVGQLWLILSRILILCVNVYTEKFQCHYSVAYSAPAECKNWGIIGNLKRIIGSFGGNK